MAQSLAFAVAVGVAATMTMDLLGSVARRLGLAAGAKGIWVGRWYLGILRGQLAHANIEDAPAQPGEKRAALVGHYVIGIVLAVAYVLGTGWLELSPAHPAVALGYGLATCVFPWFLVFPALGFGPLGLKGPAELRLLRASVLSHSFYGVGLWWATLVVELLQ